ncbi:MAG: methyltransferase, partial [Cyclobacteriaceae bacterium]|nr:methyltransferase [Cyclobacteriaceae bacterium]
LGELWIFNEDGSLVAEFHGFKSQYLKGSRGEVSGEEDKWFYEYNWIMKPRKDQELLRNPGNYLPSPKTVRPLVEDTIDEVKKRIEQKEYYEQYEPEQYKLTIGYICTSLKEMGMSFEVGTKIDISELITSFKVIPVHHRLFHHMFKLLKEAGFAKGKGDKMEITKTPDFRDVTHWMEELNKKFPQFHHESTLLGRCGPQITGVLQGTVDPIQLIFPENKWDAIVQYYVEGFAFKKYNDIASRAISELLKKVPADQTLRILEVGAGTGGMTQAILPVLPADRTEYVFTDLSHMFMLKAQQRFAKYPFVKYKVVDIEKDPTEQGIEPNSFDLIIASDVIHATRRLDETFGSIKNLLASEGVLMMLEVTNSPVYLDFIFGMTEGWWLFEDTDIRPEHATMGPESWISALEANHFSEVAVYSDFEKNDSSCQSVIMARGPVIEMKKDTEENNARTEEAGWLVFMDEGGVAMQIAQQLTALNKECVFVSSSAKGAGNNGSKDTLYIDSLSQSDMDRVIALMEEKNKFQGIIFAWGLDAVSNKDLHEESIILEEKKTSVLLMNLMKKLNNTHYDKNPDIWVLFSGAQQVAGKPDSISLGQEGLRGVARVIVNEFPVFNTTLVDFSSEVKGEEIDMLIEEIFSSDKVDELAFRGTRRYVNRLERVSTENIARRAKKTVPASGYPYIATISEYGVLDNVTLRETEKKTPAADEVEVQVKASALNFRDIMIAMGLLSDAAVEGGLFGRTFGLECSGV